MNIEKDIPLPERGHSKAILSQLGEGDSVVLDKKAVG